MNPARSEFLNLRRLPGRLNVEEVAWLLGFSPGDIPVLVASKLIKPLGKPAPNGVRYFARPDIDLLVADTKWLDKSTAALIAHWRTRNGKACSSSVPCPARN